MDLPVEFFHETESKCCKQATDRKKKDEPTHDFHLENLIRSLQSTGKPGATAGVSESKRQRGK